MIEEVVICQKKKKEKRKIEIYFLKCCFQDTCNSKLRIN